MARLRVVQRIECIADLSHLEYVFWEGPKSEFADTFPIFEFGGGTDNSYVDNPLANWDEDNRHWPWVDRHFHRWAFRVQRLESGEWKDVETPPQTESPADQHEDHPYPVDAFQRVEYRPSQLWQYDELPEGLVLLVTRAFKLRPDSWRSTCVRAIVNKY